jgi:hypothetical protein
MTATAKKLDTDIAPTITRPDPSRPVFVLSDPTKLVIVAGAVLSMGAARFAADADIVIDLPELRVGQDYDIVFYDDSSLAVIAARHTLGPDSAVVGGFHYAPGGNAEARVGGSSEPGINPLSIWDAGFRPVCPDPRGMAYIAMLGIWADIYLTNTDHVTLGTSRHGAPIADGYKSLPTKAGGGTFDKLDYAAAQAIAAHHDKRLMSFAEFAEAAFGVTEKSSDSDKAELTGLTAARTSKYGLIQATGQRWIWGTDGDPDEP